MEAWTEVTRMKSLPGMGASVTAAAPNEDMVTRSFAILLRSSGSRSFPGFAADPRLSIQLMHASFALERLGPEPISPFRPPGNQLDLADVQGEKESTLPREP